MTDIEWCTGDQCQNETINELLGSAARPESLDDIARSSTSGRVQRGTDGGSGKGGGGGADPSRWGVGDAIPNATLSSQALFCSKMCSGMCNILMFHYQ